MNIIAFHDTQVRLDLAFSLINQKRYQDASILLERISPQNLSVLLALNECYQYLGKTKEKIEILEKIAEATETKVIITELISNLEKNSQKEKALEWAIRGQNTFPHDPDFKKQVLELLLKNKAYSAAKLFLKKHRCSLAYEKQIYYQGLLAQEKGKKIKAWYFFQKLVRNYPFNILYRYLLSLAYQNLRLKHKSEQELSFIEDFIQQVPRIIQFHPGTSFSNILQQLLQVK